MQELALIKLGGSVVTFKDRPLAANSNAVDDISRVLSQLDTPIIIVHGGGSFGHHWSVKYDIHTRPARYDKRGVSVVHESMIALDQIIANSMIKAGINPYGMQPSVFAAGCKPIPAKIRRLRAMAKSKVVPLTYGDVIHVDGAKYSILSGDSIMTMLAKVLRPSRVIFAVNVDGVYSDMTSRELISEINVREKRSISFSNASEADVTGGMQRKITEAFKIAHSGMDVLVVNGLVPERIAEAVERRLKVGTLVKGDRR